jgi:hypothetical protein
MNKSPEQIVLGSVSKIVDFERAGVLYIFAGSAFILLVTLLESIYPGHSVHSNSISDLLALGRLTSKVGEAIAFLIAVS